MVGVGPFDRDGVQPGVFHTMTSDMIYGVMPALNMMCNRRCKGTSMSFDFDAPDSVRYTMDQYLGLAKCWIEAYRTVCSSHPLFLNPKNPIGIVSIPFEIREKKLACCPKCKANVGVADMHCHNDECEEGEIDPRRIVYVSTYKNGAHGVGWVEWDETAQLVPEKTAPILSTAQHLTVVEIFNVLWQKKFEEDATQVPPFVPESDRIDRNIYGSLRSTYNGAMRRDGAPKVSNCICSNASLKIDECARCGSSKIRGVRRKIIEEGRRYVPKFVLCADGTVHEELTRKFGSFEEMDASVEKCGAGYMAGMEWPAVCCDAEYEGDSAAADVSVATSRYRADIKVHVESVDEDGGVLQVRLTSVNPECVGKRYRLACLPSQSSAAEVVLKDSRYEKTLSLFRCSSAWLPDDAKLSTFNVPEHFMVRANTEVTFSKGKRLPPGVSQVDTDEGTRIVLTGSTEPPVVSVPFARGKPSFDPKVYSTYDDIAFDDPRTKAVKALLLELWPERYNENTRVKCKEGAKVARDTEGKKKRNAGLMRVLYANISGHGANMCPNACRCKCGLLRKRLTGRRDLVGETVCSTCSTSAKMGWHRSAQQFLTFKVIDQSTKQNRSDIAVKVKLCCRSGKLGYTERGGKYQCCNRVAHEKKYGNDVEFSLPLNLYKMHWIRLTGGAVTQYQKHVDMIFPELYSGSAANKRTKVMSVSTIRHRAMNTAGSVKAQMPKILVVAPTAASTSSSANLSKRRVGAVVRLAKGGCSASSANATAVRRHSKKRKVAMVRPSTTTRRGMAMKIRINKK